MHEINSLVKVYGRYSANFSKKQHQAALDDHGKAADLYVQLTKEMKRKSPGTRKHQSRTSQNDKTRLRKQLVVKCICSISQERQLNPSKNKDSRPIKTTKHINVILCMKMTKTIILHSLTHTHTCPLAK